MNSLLLLLILAGILYLIFSGTFHHYKPLNHAAMNIKIKILASDLSTSQQKTIKQALGIGTRAEFINAMEKIGKAAFLEYCKMITGSGTPSKIDDLRIDRLFMLMQHYFPNRIPNENEVDNIFHLGNKSSTLLQNTLSRYKTSLTIIESSLLEYINKAKWNNGTSYFEFECTPAIISQMNAIIREKWAGQDVIKHLYGTSNYYKCPLDTYDKLKAYLK